MLVLKLGPGAADLVAHHAIWLVAVVLIVGMAGFVWWWMKKKRTGPLLTD
jgi:hypothetical protein